MPDALMVTSSFLPGRGGIESYLADLCAALGPRIAVMAPAFRDRKPLPSDLGYPTVPGPGRMLLPNARLADAIVRVAREQGTDRVLFGTPWPLVLLGPRLRSSGLRYASIALGAELFVPASAPLLRRAFTRALYGADLLLPMSDFTAGKLRALLGRQGAPPPIEVLRARVDLERFNPFVAVDGVRRRLGLDEADQIILCFGRLVKRKGVHRVIKALPALAARHPDVKLVVAGTGPEEPRLRRLSARRAGRVVFAGAVPEQDAPAYYSAAHIFIMPVADRWFGLETEGLGVVLLEAAASGTPCVTGRSGGTVEAVAHGVTGFAIDARDQQQLVSATSRLLEDQDLARRMGAAGREFVARNYSDDTLPDGLLRWLA
jgi:phosphatidyl-myo-inositol dimannoside synthase